MVIYLAIMNSIAANEILKRADEAEAYRTYLSKILWSSQFHRVHWPTGHGGVDDGDHPLGVFMLR